MLVYTIDIKKDSYVDEELQTSYSDLVIKTSFQLQKSQAPVPGYLYLLFEHKSSPDPLVALQLNGYLQRIWKDSLQEEKNHKNQLPVILPLVIYHGHQKWKISTHFQDLIPGAADETLKPYVPHWQYQFYDLSQYSNEVIKKAVENRICQNVLMILRDIWTDDTSLIFDHLGEAFRAVWTVNQQEQPTEYLYTLMRYLWEVRDDLPKEEVRKFL